MIEEATRSPVYEILADLGLLINPEIFHRGVRDDPTITVLQDPETDIIFNDSPPLTRHHYPDRPDLITMANDADNSRRSKYLAPLIKNKVWADVGAGGCGLIAAMHQYRSNAITYAVDTDTASWRKAELDAQYGSEVGFCDSVKALEMPLEVVTLMHTFEHFVDPMSELSSIHDSMKEGGRIYIEVPHARDMLLHMCPGFKRFTLWSEHIILHTRNSLERMLNAAGFVEVSVRGIQRYPLANHLHWLAKSTPGGHEKWSQLDSPELHAAYEARLAALDITDTLWCEAIKWR